MARSVTRFPALAALLILTFVGCGKKDGPSIVDNNGANNGSNNGTNNGGLKGNGEVCVEAAECASGACRFGLCEAALCTDNIKNGDETDVDCGAIGCAPCDIGKACDLDNDCISGICDASVCVEKRCDDGTKNGLETDVDCGGLYCEPCADGGRCKGDSDCQNILCEDDVCLASTCDDQRMNGDETAEDCGGPCEPCADGLGCSVEADCESGVCAADVCSVPTCADTVQNGQETGPDCGGPDCGPCGDNLGCERDTDCISGVCDPATNMCSAPACDDVEQNGAETDVDCGGGVCAPCLPRKACSINPDCVSKICEAGTATCTEPSCGDFVQNGIETDVDCGGSCGGCADGRSCVMGGDCLSLICQGGTCQPGGCSDGALNGDETDVDCGGSCNKCLDTRVCVADGDCLSGACTGGKCAAPTCRDGRKNGNESDVDCGGSCANRCMTAQGCNLGSDCSSGVCGAGGVCAAAACPDGVKNGDETDVDCGGPGCPTCTIGDTCGRDTDCNSAICDGGAAGPICAICDDRDTMVINQTCGYQGRGKIEQVCTNGAWVDSACVGVYYKSCKEILDAGASLGDGDYELDPDGGASVYTPFDVFCDMTTDGGGWTEITKCTAHQKLNSVYTAVDAAKDGKSSSECRYLTQDLGADGHTYHWTFDFPGTYTEFRLNQYQARANADTGHTSDLGHIQRNWDAAFSNNQGDISFGNPAQAGPRDSFSRHSNMSCFDCVIDWPLGGLTIPLGTTASKFRIGWGETGTESEGWIPWYEGTILLR